MLPAEKDDRHSLKDVIASVPALRKHGRPKKDGGKGDGITFTRGTIGWEYRIGRLKRDAPEIAARAPEFPSVSLLSRF
jgi:hypothetical protein